MSRLYSPVLEPYIRQPSLAGYYISLRYRVKNDIVPSKKWLKNITVAEYRAKRDNTLAQFERENPEIVAAYNALHGN